MYLKYRISQENLLDFHTFWLSFAFFGFFSNIQALFSHLASHRTKILCSMLYALCSIFMFIDEVHLTLRAGK